MLKATSSSGAGSSLSSYVVGTGGSYAGTDAGLQAAINAAHAAGASNSAPVVIYILPSYAGTSAQITLYAGINLTGLIGENSPSALYISGGQFSGFNNNAIVTLTNQFTLVGPGFFDVSFNNMTLLYKPAVTTAQFTFSGSSGNFTLNINFNNVTCAISGSCSRMFDLTSSGTANVAISLQAEDSAFDNDNSSSNTGSFFKMATSNTAVNTIDIWAQNTAFYFPFTQSTFTGGGNNFFGSFIECDVIMPMQWVSGNTNTVNMEFIGGLLGLTRGFSSITGFDTAAHTDNLLYEFVGTQIFCDRVGGSPALLNSCPGAVVNTAVGVNLTDTVWSTDSTVNANSLAKMVGGTVSATTNNTFYAKNIITSAAYTGGTIDSAIIGSATLANAQFYSPVNVQTGTTYTIVASDCGKIITFNNASAITVTLPQQSALTTSVGFWFKFQNIGAGSVTFVKQGAETLTGNSLAITNADGEIWRNSTTNWNVFGGTSVVEFSFEKSIAAFALGDVRYFTTASPCAGTILDCTQIDASAGTQGTYTIAINGVNVTGLTTVSNTTGRVTTSATAANVFALGNPITITFATTVTGINWEATLRYTRNF